MNNDTDKRFEEWWNTYRYALIMGDADPSLSRKRAKRMFDAAQPPWRSVKDDPPPNDLTRVEVVDDYNAVVTVTQTQAFYYKWWRPTSRIPPQPDPDEEAKIKLRSRHMKSVQDINVHDTVCEAYDAGWKAAMEYERGKQQ